MAEKRMFSKQVLWSDKFIDLPSPAQVLYFQLSMYADDEGFVNCAGYVRRLMGCSESDIEALCKNGFIIPFESGVYAIAHWKINNHIRSDRMKKTSFSDERDMLYVRADGMYILDPEKAAEQRKSSGQEKGATTKCSQVSDICLSDDGTGKKSSDKDSTVKSSFDEVSTVLSDETDKKSLSAVAYKAKLTERFGADNVERYIERFNKWADMHGRQNMPVYPTIEKWMNEDNVRRYESANSSFTDEMLDECLMIDYISSDEKRTE